MRTKFLVSVALLALLVGAVFVASRPSARAALSSDASVEKARLLYRHGLTHDAKAELIQILFNATDNASKAQAHYLSEASPSEKAGWILRRNRGALLSRSIRNHSRRTL